MYNDYFELELKDGRTLLWKNFGQVITIDNKDFRKENINTTGAVLTNEDFNNLDIGFEDFLWIINAYEVGHGEDDNLIELTTPTDTITIVLNKIYNTRIEEYTEQDYFYWVNEYSLFGELMERLKVTEDKAINYLLNWRRPKLKTNGVVKMVVFHNGTPVYVGMLDAEKKKSCIDAFFRLIYYFQFLKDGGEENVR